MPPEVAVVVFEALVDFVVLELPVVVLEEPVVVLEELSIVLELDVPELVEVDAS